MAPSSSLRVRDRSGKLSSLGASIALRSSLAQPGSPAIVASKSAGRARLGRAATFASMRVSFVIAALALVVAGCRERTREDLEPPAAASAVRTAVVAAAAPADAPSAAEWNYPGVSWTSAEAGLAAMRANKRPGIVVVMATWCARCKEYKSLFYDPEVVALSKHFEMILIDAEAAPERAEKWNTDGSYFPRTFFASPTGSVDPSFVTSLAQYPHFFNAVQRGELLQAMQGALAKYPSAS
jgi:thiol:disulfide interchange protein